MYEEDQTRLSRRRLEEISTRLHRRDQAILRALEACRYMTTTQISDLHFPDAATRSAAARAAHRAVTKLQSYGLIFALERRIGGIRKGSGAYVWSLAQPGLKLLSLGQDIDPARRRSFEPSPRFLEHTLVVTQLYVQLLSLDGVNILSVQHEPNCWRTYPSVGGAAQLKPDLYAISSCDDYEDHWFFEIDLATESLARILKKCQQYQDYYRCGCEQRGIGVFPRVVWVVPDGKRKSAILSRIKHDKELYKKDLFVVILPDELESLVQTGGQL